MKAQSFFTGLLIGSAVGSVTALLLSPKTGEENRKYLKEKSTEVKDQSVHLYETVKTKTETHCNTLKEKAKKLTDVDFTIENITEDLEVTATPLS